MIRKSAHIEVTIDGCRYTVSADEARFVVNRRIREIPCPDDPPCRAVHRELYGLPRLRLFAEGDGEWEDIRAS